MKNNTFLYWLPMVALAFINAALREILFVKYMSVLTAHQLSTVTLVLFCLMYTWLVLPRLSIKTIAQALAIGWWWMILTILFEFALGLATHKSWQQLFQNYDITKGYSWPFFLLCLFMMPLLVYKIRMK